jgi:predicted nucleic acid-binding protein
MRVAAVSARGDLLLRLGEADVYEPLWSEEILAEVERNLTGRLGVPTQKAARRSTRMRTAFPNAAGDGYHDLVAAMSNDPKDRHVLAAAVRGCAALIVTANIGDFPTAALAPYDIDVVHPDDFLQDQLDLASAVTIRCMREQRAAYTRPQFSVTEYYLTLRKTVPLFADLAAATEKKEWDTGGPLPLVMVSGEESAEAFFPGGGPDPFTPLGAACLWWMALLDKSESVTTLHNLTFHPPAWGDFEEPLARLAGCGLMQFVVPCPDDNTIAYVKFMPNADRTMKAFGESPLEQVHILTMVLCTDSLWRAWGLSENYFPTAAEVKPEV